MALPWNCSYAVSHSVISKAPLPTWVEVIAGCQRGLSARTTSARPLCVARASSEYEVWVRREKASQGKEPGGSCLSFYGLALEVTQCHISTRWWQTHRFTQVQGGGTQTTSISWWGVTRSHCKKSLWAERCFHGQRIAKRCKGGEMFEKANISEIDWMSCLFFLSQICNL